MFIRGRKSDLDIVEEAELVRAADDFLDLLEVLHYTSPSADGRLVTDQAPPALGVYPSKRCQRRLQKTLRQVGRQPPLDQQERAACEYQRVLPVLGEVPL